MSEDNKTPQFPAITGDYILLEWTGAGIKHLATSDEAGQVKESMYLLPGSVTPVPLSIWNHVRPWCAAHIIPSRNHGTETERAHGRYVEHGLDLKKGPGGRVEAAAAKGLSDLPHSEAVALVGLIYDPLVCAALRDSGELDGKPLAATLERRIDEIERKGAPKKAA